MNGAGYVSSFKVYTSPKVSAAVINMRNVFTLVYVKTFPELRFPQRCMRSPVTC